MTRTTKICGNCQGTISAPGKVRGLCAGCSPRTTTHLALAGDQHTYCTKSIRWDLGDDPTHTVVHDLTMAVNCRDCLRVHNSRQSF